MSSVDWGPKPLFWRKCQTSKEAMGHLERVPPLTWGPITSALRSAVQLSLNILFCKGKGVSRQSYPTLPLCASKLEGVSGLPPRFSLLICQGAKFFCMKKNDHLAFVKSLNLVLSVLCVYGKLLKVWGMRHTSLLSRPIKVLCYLAYLGPFQTGISTSGVSIFPGTLFYLSCYSL